MRFTHSGRFQRLAGIVMVILLLLPAKPARAYSVLAHEAIIDRSWEDAIKPLLLRRFPAATACQLEEARAYCYGGCAIQDLGYLPFSSRFFSDLTHYVRTGYFVTALIRHAADLNEYAFALGALSHYAADSMGHEIAVNKVVPILNPKLRQKYGNNITYEDNPAAHIQAEFGFDVMQFASGAYATNAFHRAIGFKISKRLLQCAFLETYGVNVSSVLGNLDSSLGTYKIAALDVVPEMTRVSWEMKKDRLREQPELIHVECDFAGRAGEPACQGRFREAGSFARITALWFPIVPRLGPFRALAFKPPTAETEGLFLTSMDMALDHYRQLLEQAGNGTLLLENINLDTGAPTRLGDYRLADEAYGRLLNELAKNGFRNVTGGLRDNILAFYGQKQNLAVRSNTRARPNTLAKLCEDLARLKNFQPCIAGGH
jgi:hypothetical protein